ncbi:hypothetical protein WS62_26340 [Burkholderia sp. ABCPW 14]|nr:hypothetical protein WS62_26340 [Burkholderia sp. ABCPW 14]
MRAGSLRAGEAYGSLVAADVSRIARAASRVALPRFGFARCAVRDVRHAASGRQKNRRRTAKSVPTCIAKQTQSAA